MIKELLEKNVGINLVSDDPYGQLIKGVFFQTFPTEIRPDTADIVDAVAKEIIASGQTRFGPTPNIESQAAMRAVIRQSIEVGKPIPFLCPWGSKKSINHRSIDVAEIAGLKTILCLQHRVSNFYRPGLKVNLRLEDVGGFYLFRDEGQPARESSIKYVADFEKIVRILNLDEFINVVKESSLTTEHDYIKLSDEIFPVMLEYLQETDLYGFDNYTERASWKKLLAFGWRGIIPKEQRDFYRNRYAQIYGADLLTQNKKLAEYLAGSLARYKLHATGADSSWGNNFIQLNFAPPAPGTPQDIVARRIHYRTIPLKHTKDHLPPWRAKGYFRIYNDNNVTPALASWRDDKKFNSCAIELNGRGESVSVTTDYIVMD